MSNSEWLNWNDSRNYPFREDAGRIAKFGSLAFTLPIDFLSDVTLSVPYSSSQTFYLKSITRTGTTQALVFAGSVSGDIATLVTLDSTFQPHVAYEVTGLVDSVAGAVVFGDGYLSVKGFGVGTYTLTVSNGALQSRVVKNNPLGKVKSLETSDNPGIELTGDVVLEPGYNLSLETDVETNTIRISAVINAGIGKFCGDGCSRPSSCGSALFTINGIPPDSRGRFDFTGTNKVDFKNSPGKITIDIPVLNPSTLCERTGTPGSGGSAGPQGPQGPSGYSPTAEDCCHSCAGCENCTG